MTLCPGIVGKSHSDGGGCVVDDLEVIAVVGINIDPVNLNRVTVNVAGCTSHDHTMVNQVNRQGRVNAGGRSCRELVCEVTMGNDELGSVGRSAIRHVVDLLFPNSGHHHSVVVHDQFFARLDGDFDGVPGSAFRCAGHFGFGSKCRHGNAQQSCENQKEGNQRANSFHIYLL